MVDVQRCHDRIPYRIYWITIDYMTIIQQKTDLIIHLGVKVTDLDISTYVFVMISYRPNFLLDLVYIWYDDSVWFKIVYTILTHALTHGHRLMLFHVKSFVLNSYALLTLSSFSI